MNPLQVKEAQLGKGRKKRPNKEEWKRNKAKKQRYSSPGLPPPPSCDHSATEAFKCTKVSYQDVRRMHQKFYENPNREAQQNFILRYVTVSQPARERSRSRDESSRNRKVTTKYYIPVLKCGRPEQVPVCKKLFVNTLGVSRDRIQLLCKKFLEFGDSPKDKRGGDTRSLKYADQKQAVKAFIESLQVLESHYCRGKNITRQYLPSELTIKSLWEQYQGSHDDNLKVKYDYFRNIFDNDYNVGFGSPATDVCSTFLSLKERIKCSRDPQEKDKLKIELNVHKARADAFYKLVREQKEGEITFSFDCQKNQVIPKIPDQASYYLRQLYIYNFTICEGSSTDPQSKDKVFSYVWLENEYKKGSNQISSAMYHRLLNTDLTGVHTIKVVADGCGGQNKNKIVIGMLSKFLSQDSTPSVKK